MEKLIILTGYSRCGKDSTAKGLKEIYGKEGKTVDIFNFSWVLKKILAKILDISIDQLDEIKNKDITYATRYFTLNMRSLLKRTADVFRELRGDSFFAQQVMDLINSSNADICIITDMRFRVEYDTIKSNYDRYLIVRVDREHPDCRSRKGDEEVDAIPYDIKFTKKANPHKMEWLKNEIDKKYESWLV